jgi:hypothetical protein
VLIATTWLYDMPHACGNRRVLQPPGRSQTKMRLPVQPHEQTSEGAAVLVAGVPAVGATITMRGDRACRGGTHRGRRELQEDGDLELLWNNTKNHQLVRFLCVSGLDLTMIVTLALLSVYKNLEYPALRWKNLEHDVDQTHTIFLLASIRR